MNADDLEQPSNGDMLVSSHINSPSISTMCNTSTSAHCPTSLPASVHVSSSASCVVTMTPRPSQLGHVVVVVVGQAWGERRLPRQQRFVGSAAGAGAGRDAV